MPSERDILSYHLRQWVPGTVSSEGKRPGLEGDHSFSQFRSQESAAMQMYRCTPAHLYRATKSVSVLCDSQLILTLRIYGSLLLYCGWSCHKGFCLYAGIIRNWNRFQFIFQVIQGLPRGKYTYYTLK